MKENKLGVVLSKRSGTGQVKINENHRRIRRRGADKNTTSFILEEFMKVLCHICYGSKNSTSKNDKLVYEKNFDIGIRRLRNTSYPRHLIMSIFSPNYSQ